MSRTAPARLPLSDAVLRDPFTTGAYGVGIVFVSSSSGMALCDGGVIAKTMSAIGNAASKLSGYDETGSGQFMPLKRRCGRQHLYARPQAPGSSKTSLR